MKKITVIVPVYNVKAYVKASVQSILGQTYTNIEVILIDDGSSDGSSEICDILATTDPRIRVFHTKNRGVSMARNLGIKEATGDLLTFVDADDLIDSNMLKILFSSLDASKSDVAVCERQVFTNREDIKPDHNTAKVTLTGNEAILNMLYQNGISNAPGGKLFKRSLFGRVNFPNGVTIAEDLEVNYKLFLKAQRVAWCISEKYYYRQRKGSAMHSAFSSARMDGLKVVKKLRTEAKLYHPLLQKAVANRLFMEAIYIVIEIPFRGKTYRAELSECIKIIRENAHDVLTDHLTRDKHRVYAAVSIISVNLLIILFKLKSILRKARA